MSGKLPALGEIRPVGIDGNCQVVEIQWNQVSEVIHY